MDIGGIKRVLLNILGNSQKFTASGHIKANSAPLFFFSRMFILTPSPYLSDYVATASCPTHELSRSTSYLLSRFRRHWHRDE